MLRAQHCHPTAHTHTYKHTRPRAFVCPLPPHITPSTATTTTTNNNNTKSGRLREAGLQGQVSVQRDAKRGAATSLRRLQGGVAALAPLVEDPQALKAAVIELLAHHGGDGDRGGGGGGGGEEGADAGDVAAECGRQREVCALLLAPLFCVHFVRRTQDTHTHRPKNPPTHDPKIEQHQHEQPTKKQVPGGRHQRPARAARAAQGGGAR